MRSRTSMTDMDDDAMCVLHDRLDAVRLQLGPMLGQPLSPGIEATYVVYPEGGYYKRHIDGVVGDPQGSGRRCVSFICYLNEPGWTAKDGGALRVYDDADCERLCAYDLLPESGSLVLFDSKRVWHEVLPTRRERPCLVGWFWGV
eukprot:Transcript_13185.p1 GENE.Transcript_13185~~Transcript_13185.p1  ORF type:complete len:145 (+),score=24.62 Transcript_13185:369-803(+)